ncbi:UDP-N-acetylglucosamine 2-epimerase [Cesiribacter sp. SM1]|uniref:UDP-N-acetylglucosamine 2-epimerase n=1 Tax=Cesiribacter sp. SM1 TaxID=2861196 RepID=UPI001CD4904B|nr:UDP-N-acetylglucosamine 2-epimerase [Cesiribacter sp. SM1]
MIKVGVLTSSRADYGIYKPLLEALQKDDDFQLSIIAFGTHLSHFHGYTIREITGDGFEVEYTINSLLLHDDANSIATASALTSLKFADFWKEHGSEFNIVFCLGDRYEMFGAVNAGIPFNIRFAHIHGGETTLGAIDNVYRHCLTLASSFHFVSTDHYAKRVEQILGTAENILVTGSLSLQNLDNIRLLSVEEFYEKWEIDLSVPSILVTVHPETVDISSNEANLKEVVKAIEALIGQSYQIIITMPNSDTMGSVFRNGFSRLKASFPQQVHLVENFGTRSYFSCMKHVDFLLGNTSSGIIEAASLHKYLVNLGNRQQGRFAGENVIHCPFDAQKIVEEASRIARLGNYEGQNPYYKAGAVVSIVDFLKNRLLQGKL